MHMRKIAIIIMSLMTLSACNPTVAPTPMILPTLLPFPTIITPTPQEIAEQPTATQTEQVQPTATPTDSLTETPSPTATITQSQPSATITNTVTHTPAPTSTPVIPDVTQFPEITESRYSDISYDDAFDLLVQTPRVVLPLDHTRQIYDRGRFRGLRDDFLLSVGDCNSESGWYLESLLDDSPPESGVDASYFESTQVQSTISYYSDAFAYKGQSVNSGLNAASVLDPFWASADICQFGDSPLTCDYQRTSSFASLIMFGANDVNVLSASSYELAMREIIETTLERDVIPIISTFTVRPIDGTNTYVTGVRFNAIIVQLAQEYQIPLVNFWLATRDLADRGILEDNAHLTVSGFNIRNQLTVEILIELQDQIMNETRNA